MKTTQTRTTVAKPEEPTRTTTSPRTASRPGSQHVEFVSPSSFLHTVEPTATAIGASVQIHPSPISGSSLAKRFRSAAALMVLLAGTTYFGFRYFAYTRSWVSTDNAYVSGHIHSVSSRVAGTVKEVLVDENQTVAAGAVLARLDPADFQVRRQQALAQLTQAKAQVYDAEARIAQATAQIAREQARAVKASNDLARAAKLFEGGAGAISKQEFDVARAESDAAEAALQGARSALDSANAAAVAAKAQQEVAGTGLQDAELQLSYTHILAPAAGRIGKKNLEIGNRIQPGQPLLALVQPDVWVTANFKETQLAHLKPGQAVRIKADAFPGHTFHGRVESLSPASGAQFALLPPDNATGNFTKIVQRVPIKILIDPGSLGDFVGRLVAGMSVVVEVKVRQ